MVLVELCVIGTVVYVLVVCRGKSVLGSVFKSE